MKDITSFLEQIGLSEPEAHVWITLWQMGSSPASSIARQATIGRVTTYKILQRLVDAGLVSQTKQAGTTHFWIADSTLLQSHIQRQQTKREQEQETFVQLKSSLDQLRDGQQSVTPTIQLYEGKDQIRHLFTDIQQVIIDTDLRSIATFGTATFQEQVVSHDMVEDYAEGLIDFLQSEKILITNHVAEWWLTMEQLRKYPGVETLATLPAGDHAINMIIVGQIVYVVIYAKQPIGIRIGSPEFARALHFVLSQVG